MSDEFEGLSPHVEFTIRLCRETAESMDMDPIEVYENMRKINENLPNDAEPLPPVDEVREYLEA